MRNIEKQSPTGEQKHDMEGIKQAGELQREKLREEFDHTKLDESQREKDATSAQLEALETAARTEESESKATSREVSPAARRHGPITKKQLDIQFDRTMKHVRDELPASSRPFSKFIHLKPIEKTSDLLANTIARPNALLAGAVCAFILTLAIYLFAKNMGYRLSGFETIGAFVLGWLIGILYDYLRIMITGKKGS